MDPTAYEWSGRCADGSPTRYVAAIGNVRSPAALGDGEAEIEAEGETDAEGERLALGLTLGDTELLGL